MSSQLPNTSHHQFVVIDKALSNYESLVSQLPKSMPYVLLDLDRDGVEQLRAAISGASGLEALHVLSHGAPGQLTLGSTRLDVGNLADYLLALKEIGNRIASDGALFLYGCKVAEGTVGSCFVHQLAQHAGVDVAASSTLTGASLLGGDWEMDVQIGSVRSPPLGFPDYAHTLATVTGTPGNNTLKGAVGDDELHGLAGYDTLYGYAGNDTLEGGDGGDYLLGGIGNDLLIGGTAGSHSDNSRNNLYGEDGHDTLIGGDYTGSSDYLSGGNGDDLLQGLAGIDHLYGGSGNDTLEGGAGDDYLYGDSGNDTLEGGAGDDEFSASSVNSLDTLVMTGGAGQDRYVLNAGNQATLSITDFSTGVGGDILDLHNLIDSFSGYSGGNPFDATLGYLSLVQMGADVQLQWDRDGATGGGYGWQTVLTLNNLDLGLTPLVAEDFSPAAPPDGGPISGNVRDGTPGYDTLKGALGDDELHGLTGDDTLYGYAGSDTLEGGDGRDDLYGGVGNDLLIAGTAGSHSDTSGNNTLEGGDGHDTLIGADYAGWSWGDSLYGGNGDDLLQGLAGDDTLMGGSGNDTLEGGAGDDWFPAYAWNTTDSVVMTGGAGQDRYVLDAGNQASLSITDFSVGVGGDLLDLNNLIASFSGYSGGNPFDATLGYLSLVQVGTDVQLQRDRDGATSGSYGWQTVLTLNSLDLGLTPLVAENFVPVVPPDGGPISGIVRDGTPDDDTLEGALGDDQLHGLAGYDNLYGYIGNDTLEGGDEGDYLYGGYGNDLLIGGTAGSNSDTDLNTLFGEDGHDTLIGTDYFGWSPYTGGYSDDLYGGNGDDLLQGLAGADNLHGDAGNDTLEGGAGDDYLDGGADNDTASYASTLAAVSVNLATIGTQNTGGAGRDTLVDIEHLIGSAFADSLTGNNTDNRIVGLGGNDTLVGGAGNDTLNGGGGTDSLIGGVGNDTASYASTHAAVSVNLATIGTQNTGGAGRDTLVDIEHLIGSAFADSLTGNNTDNRIVGLGGNDTLVGGAGNDTLNGGGGTDSLIGGVGNDTYYVDHVGAVITELAGQGSDTVRSSVTQTLRANVEHLVLTGMAALNGTGNTRANSLTGNAQANFLHGMNGNDTLVGDAGNDTLVGGVGNDTLTGGLGADKFRFVRASEGLDTITDFNKAQGDKLTFISANFGALPVGAQVASRFLANTSGLAGDADDRFIFETDTNILRYDADGTGASAAVAIAKLNINNLAATDIVISSS